MKYLKSIALPNLSDGNELPKSVRVFVVLAFIASILHFAPKAFLPNGYNSLDYMYFWWAGKMWLAGENPYSEAYRVLAVEAFSGYRAPLAWGYPPTWYFLLTPLALLKFEYSSYAWQLLNLSFLIVGGWVFCSIIKPKCIHNYSFLYIYMMLMAYVFLLQSSAHTISTGQSSILIFFGLSILVFGHEKRKRWAKVVGLIILSMKPHIGLVFFCFMFFHRDYRRDVIISTLFIALMCLPALSIFGFENLVTDYKSFIPSGSQYSNFHANTPASLTGVGHVVFALFGQEIGYVFQILFVAAVAAIGGMIFNLKSTKKRDGEFHNIIYFLICVTAFMLPLHTYDLVLVSFLIPLSIFYCWRSQIFTMIGLALIFRSANVAKITGLHLEETDSSFLGTSIATVGLLFLVVGLIVAIWTKMRDEGRLASS